MNTIELKNKLIEMFSDSLTSENIKTKNIHPSYHMSIIDTIIKYYLTVSDYYEENAIKTYKNFLNTGNLIFH